MAFSACVYSAETLYRPALMLNIPAMLGHGIVRMVAASLPTDAYLNSMFEAAISSAIGGDAP